MTAPSEPNLPGIDDGDGDGDPHSDGWRSNFITQWAQAIAETSYVSMGTAQLEAFAADLTADLTGLLRAPSYDTAAGRRIGAALVAAHCTGPETLSRSLMLLSERLSEVRRLSSSQRRTALDLDRRVSRVIGDIAGGYAAALRDRTLAEQDEICRAVFATQRAAEQQLAFSEARFRAMFTEAATGIGIADLDGNILEANPALLNMFGYSAEAFSARKVSELVHPDDAPDVWEIYEELIAGSREDLHVEKRFFRADGEAIWTNLTVSLIRDDTGNPTYQIAMLEDITERRHLLARLQHQAFHDPLTGLANRALFGQRLETALSGAVGCRVGLCYLDLDGFKTVNDTLGHHHGDKLLIRIAARLEQCCPGAMVARIGGDEFVILLENTTSTAEVIALAEKVQATLSTPFRIGTQELLITTSIGIVEQPVTATNAVDLMTAADTTLYRAKNEGKNRYAVFDRARTQTEITRFTLAAAMPAGIRRGEFVLDYQPLVTLSDESWSGVEALVRWQHPTFGRLAPSRFINLAEETGAIVPLGRWVLQQACQQAAHWWRTHGDHAPVVSVNLAPSQLRDPALIDDIATILQETGLPAGHLQLELTEHAVMRDEPASLCTLNTLHDMKVRIVIDDFGTGYSNMSYLHRLPLCGLKLDASFIRELDSPSSSDPPGAKIVSALITLAHNLKLTVTAEGVETRTQLDRLRALGCDTAQGWLFGPAGPAELITQHLTSKS
jgi:diguanylate cyclase (GGDEF)-like protein/PAS domain S-box-containing protein